MIYFFSGLTGNIKPSRRSRSCVIMLWFDPVRDLPILLEFSQYVASLCSQITSRLKE